MYFAAKQPAIFTETTGTDKQQTVHRGHETAIGSFGAIPVSRN
jgi:hypothetical protein